MKQQSVFAALIKSTGYALLFLAMQLLASTLARFVISAGLLARSADLGTSFFSALQTLSYTYLYEIMILSGFFFLGAVFLIRRKKFSASCSYRPAPLPSVLGGALLGFGGYVGAVFLISFSSAVPAVQDSQSAYLEQYEAILAAHPSIYSEILYVCILGPLVEETLCRGLILNTLKRSMAPGTAVFLSALAFALIHGNLYQIVFTLPLGLLLGYLAHRFGSVLPSVACHVAFNLANYLIQIGDYLGFEEDSVPYLTCIYALLFFFALLIPLGIFLLRRARRQGAPAQATLSPEYAFQYTAEKGETMASPEYLIVGLGNPGAQYAANRHNCGFMALDYIALREQVPVKNLRFRALAGETVMDGKKVLLLKPQTFMNLSGDAVREAAAFYRIPPEKILVIFDDINFAPGVFRVRGQGSAGGHNGIKSIISSLGSDAFPRIKMGVGAPPAGWDLMHYVLGNPSPEDQKKIVASLEDVYSAARLFVAGDLDRACQLYNGKIHE